VCHPCGVATRDVALAVIAKSPAPGLVKTRLCPPCRPEEAASIALALLADAIAVACDVPGCRPVLLLDGDVGPCLPLLPAGVPVVAQRGSGLDERLELAFRDLPSPALVIAADSDIEAADVTPLVSALGSGAADAVLGPATDGGFWAIGLGAPAHGCVRGVPMGRSHTGAAQLARLRWLGMRVHLGAVRRDVDTFDDVIAAAARRPASELGRCVASLDRAELRTRVRAA
jgi:glycosyltransferase A (GT-A) superfamily protein (DUF2064 family)